MGGSSTPEVTKSTTIQEVPRWIAPYATSLARRAQKASRAPYQPYTGDRIADLNADITGAIGGTRSLVDASRASFQGGRGLLDATIAGDYLSPGSNPYLDRTFDQASSRVTDAYQRGIAAQTDTAAARANALGGSAYNETVLRNQQQLSDNLNNLATQIYGGNYQSERDRQMGAIGQLGQLGQGALSAEQALFGIGEAQRAASQEDLDFLYNQFKERQDYPLRQLDILGSAISQALGRGSGSTVQASPYMGPQSSPWANVLGGALGGAGLYGQFAQNPNAAGSLPYAAIGGLLGGLSG